MKLPSLTNKAIRTYVLSLPPDQPVGQRKDGQRCLVANYLRHELETKCARVSVVVSDTKINIATWSDSDWTFAGRQERVPSPALRRLINRFDNLASELPLPADVLPLLEDHHDA
jgi:hypothetical protein